MGWIVGKPIKVQRNGRIVSLKPGDPVPEASTFRNRKAWERSGHIRWVEDPAPVPAGRKEPKSKAPAETQVDEKPAETPPALEVKKPVKAKPAAKKVGKKKTSKKKATKKKG